MMLKINAQAPTRANVNANNHPEPLTVFGISTVAIGGVNHFLNLSFPIDITLQMFGAALWHPIIFLFFAAVERIQPFGSFQ
jgi:hypothetical protein